MFKYNLCTTYCKDFVSGYIFGECLVGSKFINYKITNVSYIVHSNKGLKGQMLKGLNGTKQFLHNSYTVYLSNSTVHSLVHIN